MNTKSKTTVSLNSVTVGNLEMGMVLVWSSPLRRKEWGYARYNINIPAKRFRRQAHAYFIKYVLPDLLEMAEGDASVKITEWLAQPITNIIDKNDLHLRKQ